MKPNLFHTFFIGVAFLFFGLNASAQYTETFESQTPYVKSFVSNGQPFTLTNAFTIYSSRNGIGYNGSNRFVDNISNPAANQINAIKTTDGKLFNVRNMWLFTSTDGGNNPSSNGSLLITGKVNGITIFSFTKTVGFNNSYGHDNGFGFLDFTNESGTDYSPFQIDELSIQLQGAFNYIALDNFTWTESVVLPVSVISFGGHYQNGKVQLNWQTSCESNSSHFIIEKSANGAQYHPVAQVKGAGFCSVLTRYSAEDLSPGEGTNFYRLIAVDFDGKKKNHGVIMIKNQLAISGSTLYPNPATGNTITLRGSAQLVGKLYTVIDMGGKIHKSGIVSGSSQSISISGIPAGNYILKLSDGQTFQWIKN